jgi:hypothetical protein
MPFLLSATLFHPDLSFHEESRCVHRSPVIGFSLKWTLFLSYSSLARFDTTIMSFAVYLWKKNGTYQVRGFQAFVQFICILVFQQNNTFGKMMLDLIMGENISWMILYS